MYGRGGSGHWHTSSCPKFPGHRLPGRTLSTTGRDIVHGSPPPLSTQGMQKAAKNSLSFLHSGLHMKIQQTRTTFVIFLDREGLALLPYLPFAKHLFNTFSCSFPQAGSGHTRRGRPGKKRQEQLTTPCHHRSPPGQLGRTTSSEDSTQCSQN